MTPCPRPETKDSVLKPLAVATALCVSLTLLVPALPAAAQGPAAPAHAPLAKATDGKPASSPGSILYLASKASPIDPVGYAPRDLRRAAGTSVSLRKDAATAIEDLFEGAARAGHRLRLESGYRSYDRQASLYARYTRQYGEGFASRISAKAGTSEHQLGLAADIGPANGQCTLKACFGDTASGKWVAAHAYEFGLIVRYPSDGEKTTGYKYEPWHLRYIGIPDATAMKKASIGTFEQYLAAKEPAMKPVAKKPAAKKPATEAAVPSLAVLRLLAPFRDWSAGFDFN
ncbi:M15 family metallopeptidase [Paeniglutamicibacter cryotolerans]|uniref:D-alanyl-D-alanine carboxypeptidase n=1 Tax=Paeniglutamicibacter cryotolerans TaxID=670079 RepID=A0A839QM67_9MICC|nr:M15 family metallopeptidase [Paeniglutamicibacter cryotolerans]MBB2994302.1 D-alanyl-D-alanine carboxypeptidase [Paeniglutamicibacter cryotolerans]